MFSVSFHFSFFLLQNYLYYIDYFHSRILKHRFPQKHTICLAINISTPLKVLKKNRTILTNDQPCTSSFYPLLRHQIRRITFPFSPKTNGQTDSNGQNYVIGKTHYDLFSAPPFLKSHHVGSGPYERRCDRTGPCSIIKLFVLPRYTRRGRAG